MAANNIPIFPKTPVNNFVSIATANTNKDGSTGAYATLHTVAAASGGFIQKFTIKALTTTTAGLIRIFIDGFLVHEEQVTAITVSATQQGFQAIGPWNLPVESGQVIKCSTEKSETFTVGIHGWENE
jgi:hypothetical protein